MKYIPPSLAVVLILAATLLVAPAAHGQTVAPVPAPTIITSAPYTINASGFYQLGADLTYNGSIRITNDAIITINVPNVTLDFGGHYISGPSANPATPLYGVYANDRGNLNIQNGTVSHCFIGIELTSTNGANNGVSGNINQQVRNVLATHCYYSGIDLQYTTNSIVSGCRASFIGGTTATHYAGFAIGIGYEYTNGAGCQANNNAVTNVTAGSGYGYGVFANNASVMGNVIDTVTGSGAGYGIYQATASIGNTISNCAVGISYSAKYKDNVTINCATPFDGGTAVGTNN